MKSETERRMTDRDDEASAIGCDRFKTAGNRELPSDYATAFRTRAA
jgi:hypothetical protein